MDGMLLDLLQHPSWKSFRIRLNKSCIHTSASHTVAYEHTTTYTGLTYRPVLHIEHRQATWLVAPSNSPTLSERKYVHSYLYTYNHVIIYTFIRHTKKTCHTFFTASLWARQCLKANFLRIKIKDLRHSMVKHFYSLRTKKKRALIVSRAEPTIWYSTSLSKWRQTKRQSVQQGRIL